MNDLSTLYCPKCSRPDGLAIIETVIVVSPCDRITPEGPDYKMADESEVEPESVSESGVLCSCGWRYEGDDWASHLDTSP